ncbi:MAG: acyltransferase family protein, partial [Acidimicrobiales bacterium]
MNIAYIPALDGVRAVAMLVIMGYHGGVFLTNGGFYSLDTFFALSGFLITSLLVAEWRRTGTVRLREFWARRARRLVAGLLLLLVAVAAFNAFLVTPGTYTHLRSDALSTLFYFANWHFIAIGSNYFDQTGNTSPLLHTWSLAVEEQFYLLWPLIVLGVLTIWRSLRALLVVCVVGTLASASEMAVLYSPAGRNRVYYGTDTRAQALLVGAALAVGIVLWADRRARTGPRTGPRSGPRTGSGSEPSWSPQTQAGRAVMLTVGLGGVVGTALLWILVSFNDSFAFRGGFLLAALATAAVLASVSCHQQSVLARCLSVAPLRYIGRISYGMYLWHFPLFAYVDNAHTGLEGWELFAVRAVATIAVATVSFYVVERPIRQGRLLRNWRAWVATPVAVLTTVVAVLLGTVAQVAAAPTASAPVSGSSGIYSGPPVKVLL